MLDVINVRKVRIILATVLLTRSIVFDGHDRHLLDAPEDSGDDGLIYAVSDTLCSDGGDKEMTDDGRTGKRSQ